MSEVSRRTVAGVEYERIPVKTHLVGIGEDLGGVVALYAADQITPDTAICLSEKFVSICQANVRHIDDVKDSWLARMIVKYVTKYPNDIGYSHPKKMQVAIDEAGYPRMVAAVIGGGFTKFVLKRRGDFYRIAGHRISEIDGFNPDAMAPFDQYAMLPPKNPDAVCEELAKRFGCSAYMIDGNNINVEVIGMSANLPMTHAEAREVMLDNPMGQNDEMTPIFLIRALAGAVGQGSGAAAADTAEPAPADAAPSEPAPAEPVDDATAEPVLAGQQAEATGAVDAVAAPVALDPEPEGPEPEGPEPADPASAQETAQ